MNKEHLIDICNKYLEGLIDKSAVEDFAFEKISTDDYFFEVDDFISDTLFDWDNEALNYEINSRNMLLWKQRLLTGVDELPKYNIWNYHFDNQKNICEKFSSKWTPINQEVMIGVSDDLSKEPLHGLRHTHEDGTSGWYIWSGEFKDNPYFFKSLHAKHLLQLQPDIIKYLALEPGYRFLTDNKGYEDVWFDENLII